MCCPGCNRAKPSCPPSFSEDKLYLILLLIGTESLVTDIVFHQIVILKKVSTKTSNKPMCKVDEKSFDIFVEKHIPYRLEQSPRRLLILGGPKLGFYLEQVTI